MAGFRPRYDFSHGGLAIHGRVLYRLENFLLYSSFQRVTNQLIRSVLPESNSFWSRNHYIFITVWTTARILIESRSGSSSTTFATNAHDRLTGIGDLVKISERG
jgi:hypothetical protein